MGTIKLPENSEQHFIEHFPEIFASGNLAEGKWGKEIEKWSCSYTKAKYALAVNSNGAGIHALLSICKYYKNRKKIFLQSNTMYGVRTMAITSGLEMIGYVDCSLDYLMPTYEQVNKFIQQLNNPKDCVFLLTHIGGWVNPDIKHIAELCKEKDVILIEDCAHSLGSLLNGEHTGLFGDAGVYSLYATKAVPAGEGGIVVTNNEELFTMMSKFVIYDRFEQNFDLGINIRMSELNALISYAVILETDAIINNKYKVAEKYIKTCQEYGWEYINPKKNGQRSNLYKFILLSRSKSPIEEFKIIKTRTSPVYDYYLGEDLYGITKRHICLPIWYKLESEEIDKVILELRR